MSNADKLDNVHRLITGYNGGNDGGPPMELVERVVKLEVIAEHTAKAIDRLDRSIERMDKSIGDLRQDVDRKFNWVIGSQIGILLAIVGVLAKAAHLF